MAQKVEVFKAADGKVFDTESEADAHDEAQRMHTHVVAFASERAPKSTRERTRIVNTVTAWEARRATLALDGDSGEPAQKKK